YFCRGELAEWSNAAVLKTVNCNRFGGSNPSLSARKSFIERWSFFRLGAPAVLEVTTSSGSSIRFEPKGRAGSIREGLESAFGARGAKPIPRSPPEKASSKDGAFFV